MGTTVMPSRLEPRSSNAIIAVCNVTYLNAMVLLYKIPEISNHNTNLLSTIYLPRQINARKIKTK